MVKVQLHLVVCTRGSFGASILKLRDQVFVRDLGKSPALLSIEVDVVHIQRCGRDGGHAEAAAQGSDGGPREGSGGGGSADPVAIGGLGELDVDLDLVVLEGDQGEGKTGVAAEPELQRNVQGLALDNNASGVNRPNARQGSEIGGVADHVGISDRVARALGELVPNVEPSGVVLVNALATDLQLDTGNQNVTQPVQPTETSNTARGSGTDRQVDIGDLDLEVRAVDQITITRNGACNLLTEISGTIEGLLNRFKSKISISAINYLKDRCSRNTNFWGDFILSINGDYRYFTLVK